MNSYLKITITAAVCCGGLFMLYEFGRRSGITIRNELQGY